MKKIVIILMFVASGGLFGLDHGLITGFKIGYNLINHSVMTVNDESSVIYDNSDSFEINMLMGYRIGKLRLLGEYRNTLNMIAIDNYNPIQDRFKVEVSYTFDSGFYVKFFHWCDHPVTTQCENRDLFINEAHRQLSVGFYREF